MKKIKRVASCPARDYCRKYVKHEGYEIWTFCKVRTNIDKYKHPIPEHLVGTHYTGYPKEERCPLDGRDSILNCDIYKEAIDLGFIYDDKIRVMSEFLDYLKTNTKITY